MSKLHDLEDGLRELRSLEMAVDTLGDRVKDLESRADRGARRDLELLARLVEADPHQWSTRPCQTCTTASSVLGRSFGCVAKAAARVER